MTNSAGRINGGGDQVHVWRWFYTHTQPVSWHILKPTNSLSSYTATIHEPACLCIIGWRQQGVPPGRNSGGRPAAQPRWELHFPQCRAAGRDLRRSTGQKWARRRSCVPEALVHWTLCQMTCFLTFKCVYTNFDLCSMMKVSCDQPRINAWLGHFEFSSIETAVTV